MMIPTDEHMNVQGLKEIVRKFSQERDWDKFHNPKDLAIGVVTEGSELLELFRFKGEEEIDQLMKQEEFRKKVGEEISDVLYFLLRFADLYGFDISMEFLEKMKKNAMKYPVEKSKGNNKKYDEL